MKYKHELSPTRLLSHHPPTQQLIISVLISYASGTTTVRLRIFRQDRELRNSFLRARFVAPYINGLMEELRHRK